MCPPIGKLTSPTRGFFERGLLICHCLLIETERDGLVLVDTGLGTADVADPERLGPIRFLLASDLKEEETAVRRVEALGHSAGDVRHIVVTHLDLDHAGGLGDFPKAKVHCMRKERDAAANPRTHIERERYRPAQWAHDPEWALYAVNGERWFGFEAVRDLDGLPPEILLVPLHGHSRGHAAVAVDSDDGWLLHAGDAYFFHGEMDPGREHCPPGLRAFQRIAAIDDAQRRWNQRRLRALVREHAHEVRVFSAHDPAELTPFAK